MTHIPGSLDIKTDLRRAIMASFSDNGFNSPTVKVFVANAEKNLQKIKLTKDSYAQVIKILKKARDVNNPIEKRREDLLTVSVLI